jgi:hypothetical protein
VAALLAALAVIVAVSGGFRTTVGGLRISARSPLPIAFLALTNGVMWLAAARRHQSISGDLEAAWRAIEHRSSQIIGVLALVSAIVAAAFATRSAAGADASGYLSQAAKWTVSPPPLHVELLAQDLPQLDGWLTTPLGWRPGRNDCDSCKGVQVPTYPPGLPLLMAVPHWLGGINGASSVVIASAAVAVWATGMLAGGIAGVVAAILLAISPVFLLQSFQPMSDVPVTAAWVVCFLLMRVDKPSAFAQGDTVGKKGSSLQGCHAAAGVACAIAILIRPNLAPLAIVPFVLSKNRVMFAVPVAIAGIALGSLQSFWYGSPLRSGYGPTEELFAFANIAANLPRYFNWLIETAPILLLAVFGFWRLRRDRTSQALFAFAVLVVCAYLVYAVFDDWSYLRFLLPSIAVLAVFTAIELVAWIERWPRSYRAPILFALGLLVTAHGIWIARSHGTFKLATQSRRVAAVADYINADVPPSAVIVAGEQSGSMRYYTDRPILRWEAASPDSLSAAMATLEQSRRPVYIVLDAWEHAPFRAKFRALPAGALDWPPMLDAGTSHRTQLWKLSDRERFTRGEQLNTIRLP